MVPQSHPRMKARTIGVRAMTTIKGTSPIQASHHRLKSGKETTSNRADAIASEVSASVGKLARTNATGLKGGFRFGASRTAASCMRRSLAEYARRGQYRVNPVATALGTDFMTK